MVDRFSDHDRSRSLRSFTAPMFLGHFACRRCIPILLLAYGLWGKLSDRTEIPDHGSSPEQQSDNLGAHFLSDAEKCCVSLLPAHCRVFGFRSRPARRSVSRAQFSVSRKWLLASLGLPNQRTLTCEKRRLRPRSSRRLRNLSMTSSSSRLRAVLASAPLF